MIVQLSVHVMIAKVSENICKCGPQEAVNFWKNGALHHFSRNGQPVADHIYKYFLLLKLS